MRVEPRVRTLRVGFGCGVAVCSYAAKSWAMTTGVRARRLVVRFVVRFAATGFAVRFATRALACDDFGLRARR